jgi:hypothetical protein
MNELTDELDKTLPKYSDTDIDSVLTKLLSGTDYEPIIPIIQSYLIDYHIEKLEFMRNFERK